MRLPNIYSVMISILAGVLPVFLAYGLVLVQVTPQNKTQVSNVMVALITVDVSERRFVLIRGNDILRVRPIAPQASP